MKPILLVFALILLMSCTKQASNQLATEQAKKGKGHPVAEAIQSGFTITNNQDGTFSIDYNGITDFDWMFFGGSDSLSTVSGNIYPAMTQSFWKNPVTTFTAWPSLSGYAYYQAVLVTWSNQVIYSNIVQ